MKWDRLKCRALDAFELKLLKTCCAVLSRSVMSDSLQPARLLCPLEFSRQEYWNRLPCPAPGDLPNPGIEPASLRSQAVAGSLPLAPPGKPKNESCSVMSNSLRPHGLYSPWNSLGQNTGVGSHSLLQGIFPTQESSQGLLHCRRILYQLSYQGSPCPWVNLSGLQSQMLWGSLSSAGPPDWRVWYGVQTSHSFGRTSAIVCETFYSRDMGFDYTTILSLLILFVEDLFL